MTTDRGALLGSVGSLRRGRMTAPPAPRELTLPGLKIANDDGLANLPPSTADVEAAGDPEPVCALTVHFWGAEALLART